MRDAVEYLRGRRHAKRPQCFAHTEGEMDGASDTRKRLTRQTCRVELGE